MTLQNLPTPQQVRAAADFHIKLQKIGFSWEKYLQLEKKYIRSEKMQSIPLLRHWCPSKETEDFPALSREFASHFLEHANGQLGRLNNDTDWYGDVHFASTNSYISSRQDRKEFYSLVNTSSSDIKNAMQCYWHCSYGDKTLLDPKIFDTISNMIKPLVFADKSLGEFDQEKKTYVIRDSIGSYFSDAIRCVEKLMQLGIRQQQVDDIRYNIYHQYLGQNPYLGKELKLNLCLDAYAAAYSLVDREFQLKMLKEEFGITVPVV